jgi:gamma-glutamylcyclotransferase (GGCT)/AIG2-like uncharacterized protein YtfP
VALRSNYFAYDVTVNQEVMKRIIGTWYGLSRAILEDYRLVFDTYSAAWRGGIAGIEEAPGHRVPGALYIIEHEDFERLDKYQGLPALRSRIKVSVATEGGVESAHTYISVNPRRHVAPSKTYVTLIAKGLRALGFQEAELASLEEAGLSKL